MGLFDELAKYGIDAKDKEVLFGISNDSKSGECDTGRELKPDSKQQIKEEAEADYIYDKEISCFLCDRKFPVKVLKSAKLRRLEPDADLRPRAKDIDILKYEITSCPYCGYSAMPRFYENIVPAQKKLIRESIGVKYKPVQPYQGKTYSYDYALNGYNLALANAVAKRAKTSEKAFLCLNIAWLLREKAAQLPEGAEQDEVSAEQKIFYRQAYDGFLKAIQEEYFPICGMDQLTCEYLVAYLAYYFKEYQTASKLLSGIMGNKSASRRIKDKALDLKEQIVAEIKQENE